MHRLCRITLTGGVIALLLICGRVMTRADENDTGSPAAETAQDFLKKGDMVFDTRRYEESRSWYKKALAAAKETGNKSDLAEALAMIARTYLALDETEAGRPWLDEARRYVEFDQPLGWSRYVAVKGRFLWKVDKRGEAAEIFKNLYNFCSENGLYERAIDAAQMVAITGSNEEQIYWGRKAIREAENGGLDKRVGPLWNNLGATYEETEQYWESLEAYRKAREYHYRYGTEADKAIADWALGHAYLNLGDYQNAALWLKPLSAIFEKLGDGEFAGLTCRELGEIELAAGTPEKALELFRCAAEKLKAANMPEWDPSGYQKILDRINQLENL